MMYRPGMGVDPWYENFKFFLTYWLLSSNNRERMGDLDQLPPPPPNGPLPQGHTFMSPHHKPQHNNAPTDGSQNNEQGNQNQNQSQNQSSKSPNSAPPSNGTTPGSHQINWDALEKNPPPSANSPRHNQPLSLTDNYGELALKQHFQQQQQLQNGAGGNHIPQHHMNHSGLMTPDHMISEKDRRHVCPHCYKGFRSRQQLNQHNLVHSGLRKYNCLYCERSFKQLSHLQQHHRIHTGEKPYRCPLDGCDKAFAQMSNLQHHMRQHDKTTFGQKHCMCPFCDRGYASEKSLKSHLSKMHPDSKMLSLGSPRSNLSLLEGQGHTMLGSPQPGVTISHRHSLPTMHPGMKSPLTPPGGPLELTVNSHQRQGMGPDGRKFSLDSSKGLSLNGDLAAAEAKFFQRSLSERLPDRDQNKIDNILDQRFGLQNHIRDVGRFSGRSFEPFSPSRFHDTVRSMDFKELESKFLDPSGDRGDKFQKMAENFNEFRSRFQDQMFQMNRRGDSIGGNTMPSFDNRNMLHEMNERNSFFNSRSDMGLNNRDRYQNNRSFSRMSVNDMDSYSTNRHDDLRVQSRGGEISMNSPNTSEYNRPIDGHSEDINMMEARNDVRGGNGLRVDQNMPNMRVNSDHGDVVMNRGSVMQVNHGAGGSDMRVNRRNSLLMSQDNEMVNVNHRNGGMDQNDQRNGGMNQRNGGIDHRNVGMDQNDQRNGGIDHRNGGMDMNMGNGRIIMADQDRNIDVMGGRNNLISHRNDMMNVGNESNGMDTRNDVDIVNHNTINTDTDHDVSMHQESEKSRKQELALLDGTDLRINRNNDIAVNQSNDLQMRQNSEMALDDGIVMGDVNGNAGNDVRVHSRAGSVQMNMCNDIQMRRPDSVYSDKSDMRMNQNNIMMSGRNEGSIGNIVVHDDLSMNRPASMHPIANQGQKQNGHVSGNIIPEDGLAFVDGNDNKNSPTSSQMSDPNMIRQRKRKPTNPQHVFMPSIDHYTSFAGDEVEDCGNLMLDVENGGNFDRKMAHLNMRN